MVARTTPKSTALVSTDLVSTSCDPEVPAPTAADFIDRIVALRPVLRRQAAYLIGRRTEIGTPDDFVQDALVTALQIGHRFEDDNLAGWLLAILDGHIRNARRRAHVRTSVPLPGPGDVVNDESGLMEFPIAATQEQPLHLDDVMTALRTLSTADQEIIWLARVDGLSQDEIATQLNLPLGTIYSRLSRATARLRAACEAEPQPEAARPLAYRRAA
ncbi:MAG: sigma-70 family RNA polymerase sigma factor [Rhizobiales bacterium]|nr:sigma-70 family RNA polymerase sigma factor [Hyphomicrobiales bacterium]